MSETNVGQTPHRGHLSEEALRDWSNILALWRACDKQACKRAAACRGNVRACTPVNFARVPEGVQAWFATLIVAREERVPFDEVMAGLSGTPAEQAFHDWRAGGGET